MADTPSPTEAKPGMPRWVKVMAIVAVVVALLIVVVMKISGGQHGPGRHLPGGDSTPPASVPAGHTPPEGLHG